MSQNPANLVVRFLLELAALYFIGRWGWIQGDGALRYVLAIGLPLLAAFVWGTFRVPGDGGAPWVQVPGAVRLLIEFIFFGFAIWSLFATGAVTMGWLFGGITLIHYQYFTKVERIPEIRGAGPSAPAPLISGFS